MQVRGSSSSASSTVLESHAGANGPARSLFRDPDAPKAVGNMMYDKRVVRGTGAGAGAEGSSAEPSARTRRAGGDSQRLRELGGSEVPPVAGRAHSEIQTETYLEVLADRAPEEECGVQTDAALNRPPVPLFVPAPSGVDAVTQIAPGDLFDFDFEVAPLVDVLVGRTLEQACAEVAQEAELAAIRSRRAEFEAVRSAELAEVQRMESEVKRRFAEKTRRVEQERERLAREASVREKIAAAAFARSYLTAMRRNVFASLHKSGHFYDPLKRDIQAWMPAIFATVAERTGGTREVAEGVVAALIGEALVGSAGAYGALVRAKEEAEAARLAAIAAAAAEAERKRAEEEAAAAALAAAEAAGEGGGEEAAAE